MHTLEEYEIAFDPEKSENPTIRDIFRDQTATVLWCCIKKCHLASQFFNDQILSAAKEYNKLQPESYRDFIKIMEKLTYMYGTITVSSGLFLSEKAIDNEFWGDIWKALQGKRLFKIKRVPESGTKYENIHS